MAANFFDDLYKDIYIITASNRYRTDEVISAFAKWCNEDMLGRDYLVDSWFGNLIVCDYDDYNENDIDNAITNFKIYKGFNDNSIVYGLYHGMIRMQFNPFSLNYEIVDIFNVDPIKVV